MKRIIVSIALVSASFWGAAQTDIANARTFGAGQTVTVHGVATNGSELGSIRYMQDNTAGIAGYGGPISGVNRYDSISVTGPLIEFSGLLEISTVTNVVNHGPAVITPVPQQLPILSFNESKESQLVQVLNVTFVQSGVFAGNKTYKVTDGANTLDDRMQDIDKIINKYLKPFTPTGTKPKTPTQQQKSDERNAQDKEEIQAMLSDEFIYDVVEYTMSKEEAQMRLKQFLTK